jgi:hypothetical protein
MGSLRTLYKNNSPALKFRGHDTWLIYSCDVKFDNTIDGFIWNWIAYHLHSDYRHILSIKHAKRIGNSIFYGIDFKFVCLNRHVREII